MAKVIRKKRINVVKKLVQAEIEQRILAFVITVEASAKRYCPVDLGDLSASIDHAVVKPSATQVTGLTGTNKEYAPWVEFGTGEYAENGEGRKGGWYFTSPRAELSGGKLKPIKQLEDGSYLYHTYGSRPQPFLRPAQIDNERFLERSFTNG